MERRRLGHTLRHLTTGGSKDAEGYEDGPSVPLWDGPAPESSDGGEFQPSMDIRLHPTATGPLGAVLIMPGGGYGGRATDHEGYQIAVSPPRSCVQRWHPEAECSVCVLQERCNAAGFHAFILQYRVSPNVHPAPLMDASRAIRIVRSRSKEWGVHPDQIAVLGFSAGGHLAGSISTLHHRFPFEAQDDLSELSNRPDATIMGCAQLQPPRRLSLSLSGPCQLTAQLAPTDAVVSSGEHAHRGSFQNLLGADATAEEREAFSLDKQVDEQTPQAFLWHTTGDTGVPVENSMLYASGLRAVGTPFEMHVFPGLPHGIGLGNGKHGLQGPSICSFSRKSSLKVVLTTLASCRIGARGDLAPAGDGLPGGVGVHAGGGRGAARHGTAGRPVRTWLIAGLFFPNSCKSIWISFSLSHAPPLYI
jgi:acetyl esterase/lipase